jgi:PAS domain S-box-containing protein
MDMGFKKLVESGVRESHDFHARKPIILSNYIALILIGVNILLLIAIPGNRNLGALAETGMAVGFFSIPFVLNHFRFYTVSRLYLCWCPPVFYTWFMLVEMQESSILSVTTFDGLRFYLLAYSCIPYLLFERKEIFVLLLGVIPGFFCLVFSDLLLRLFELQIGANGIVLEDYDITPIRSLVSYLIINASCLSLKVIIDRGDKVNQKLLTELREKNELISKNAKQEVEQLNAQLKLNLQQVSEREFLNNQSQRIAKVGSWEYFEENKQLYFSEEMYNILGIDRRTHPNVSFSEIIGKEQTEILTLSNEQLLKSGRPYELTLSAKTPLGHTRWVRVYAFPIEDENKIMGVRGIGHDITLMKEAEELVHANERKYRSLFEQASDAIMITDFKGNFIEVNESLCRLLGYTKDELARMNILDLVEPGPDEKDPLQFNALVRGEQVFNERRIRHRNGSFIDVEANLKMFAENRIMAISRDITERKRDQEKLLLSQANLHATINNTEIMIWSVDRDYKLLTFNKAFYNYVKEVYHIEVSIGEWILGTTMRAGGENVAKKWEQHYIRALAGQIVTLEENTNGRDIYYSLSPIIESNQIIGVSIFAEDVTERKAHDRELAEANRKLGEMKLMALRSVMSPHFIFNVLNSIQYYIAKNDRLNAINYLSTFSKLIRSVLTHSVNNKIKLSDEIELLQNYVQLEMTRFENKFDYILEIEPELNPSEIEIPSLLIQPYVENAILHGLYNKKDKGILWLRICEKDDMLIFEIEDNGIGRQEALKLKQQTFSSHKSMGIKLTEERLRLINQHYKTSLEIEDLRNEHGALGTRVRVCINY